LGLISSTGEKKESSSFKRLKGNGKRWGERGQQENKDSNILVY
jgi:hypothetical protein